MMTISVRCDERRGAPRWAGYVNGRRVGRWARSLEDVVQVLRLRHGALHLTSALVLSTCRQPERWGWWVEFDLPHVAVLGLTLRPWWAWAVAHAGKQIENRTRPIPPALIGERIAIHAGAWSRSSTAWLDQRLDPLDAAYPGGRAARRERHGSPMPWCRTEHFRPPRWGEICERHIVATAVLSSCEPSRAEDVPPWADPSAKWWWRLGDVRPLRQPVPVERGQLGLWRLPEATARAVEEATTNKQEG